ncbi:MAG TPA: FAD-dependent oxidoreductase, partial [Thermodesulfobacteriota bacterium]|nr:FAD-dependent oxidoreductase [Thermodesulfobacteriota bacterium]
HGYLIDQFLSLSCNKRKDIYGGNLENRVRLLTEIIKAIKGKIGGDFPVWVRINAMEYGVENGRTLEEAKEIARLAQEAGADAIHVSAYGPKAPQHLTMPKPVSGVLADLAHSIKQDVRIPVIVVGRITPQAGERILAERKADLVAIGKAFLADPEIPAKVAANKAEEIRPCILCMACRDDLFFDTGASVRCQVNPALGKEAEFKIVRAQIPKKVLIVGGGPAGMEAARVAAQRGHKVALWEKNSTLGGQLNYAAISPYKNGIVPLIKYYQTQMEKLGIGIELRKAATATMIKEFQPEVVVLATGAVPIIPEIGKGKRSKTVTALEVLGGYEGIQERIAVVGGGLIGCETAEFLAERYKDIIILEMLEKIGSDIGPTLRPHILERLKAAGIQIEVGIKITEITEKGVMGLRNGRSEFFNAGTIVIAVGMKSESSLAEYLKATVPEIYLVGDCVEPRRIREAIAEGYCTGLKI